MTPGVNRNTTESGCREKTRSRKGDKTISAPMRRPGPMDPRTDRANRQSDCRDVRKGKPTIIRGARRSAWGALFILFSSIRRALLRSSIFPVTGCIPLYLYPSSSPPPPCPFAPQLKECTQTTAPAPARLSASSQAQHRTPTPLTTR